MAEGTFDLIGTGAWGDHRRPDFSTVLTPGKAISKWKKSGVQPADPTKIKVAYEIRDERDGESDLYRRRIRAKIQSLPPGDVKDILTAMARHELKGSL